MKVAVLGGLGLQGQAALMDLVRSDDVREITCADANLDAWERVADRIDTRKIKPQKIDASSLDALTDLLGQGFDVAIDLLPVPLMRKAFESAVRAGVSMVCTNYGPPIRELHEKAMEAGISFMPECGLDPGIDLIIFGHAARRFDELHVLNSYCGGFPEKKACDNPINYKISWNWDGVLRSLKRESVFIKNGKPMVIGAENQHDEEMIKKIPFPELGELEAIPNGDAAFYTDLLGVSRTIKETGRYSLRWPGWSAFWRPLKQMDFLSEEPVPGLSCDVSPHQMLVQLMGPRLQYRDNEKDLVVMLNIFEGMSGGKKIRLTTRLLIERDLKTGIMAMGKGVGFPASIVAQMIARREINARGVLAPSLHVPYRTFMNQMAEKGVSIEEEEEILN